MEKHQMLLQLGISQLVFNPEETAKENIVENLKYSIRICWSPEDLHSLFFMRKPERWLSGLSHGGQATKFTFSLWQKHPRTTNTDQRFYA